MKKSFLMIVLSVALSGATAYGVAKYATESLNGSDVSVRSAGGDPGMVRTVNLSLSDYPDFTYAAENAVESVVYVKVVVKSQSPGASDPFFRFFFGDAPQEQAGSGSGVIIRQDGYIVTNNHVVANATSIQVTLNNNKSYEARIIGTDAATDVALIKIDAEGLPALQLADSDKLRLGEWVLAIGSPLGEELRSTITAGIVSAKGRSMPNYKGEFKIESFIQTDAAVNPGNSGGALVNKEGQLVGINTMIVSTTGSFSGYSFAVPSNIVRKIVTDLIDFGSVKRAKLGISMTAIDDKLAKDLKLSSMDGVYIAEVVKNDPADNAGVKKGDILVAIDGETVKNPSDLQVKVNNFHPDDKAVLTVIRDGKTLELPVTLAAADGMTASVGEGEVSFYGAVLALEEGKIVIKNVGNGKVAAAGAMDGFVITHVNDNPVEKPQDVVDIAKKTKMRTIYIEGFTPAGRQAYFAFGK